MIIETPEFKCLQSRYTALVNESVHLRHQLAEARELVKSTKTLYEQQFEKLEVRTDCQMFFDLQLLFFQQEEFENQRKLHAHIEEVVANLAEVRRDYEVLQGEYEKVLISNQQSGKMKRKEMNII